jgi:hypothetical protein
MLKSFLFLVVVLVLVSCRDAAPVPTLAPTAAPPTQLPASQVTQVLPTPLAPTPTPTSEPTATPVLAIPEPTALSGSDVNITSPSAGVDLLQGSEVSASGLVRLDPSHTFSVTLASATGYVLAESVPAVEEFNTWQTTLLVPHSVSGPAEIRASVIAADGSLLAEDVLPVNLVLDPDASDRYLDLYRPVVGDSAAAGFNLFFDGRAQQPVSNVVTIMLWNECRVEVTRQSFQLSGSGYWQGFLVVPTNVSGPACAIARFGAPGDENWREAQVTLEVAGLSEEPAPAVLVGNPPPESVLDPGRSLLLYGTAYNAPESTVTVSILLENGRVLTEGVTAADIFGYWELELFIPADAEGPAVIRAAVGDEAEDYYARHESRVMIGTENGSQN